MENTTPMKKHILIIGISIIAAAFLILGCTAEKAVPNVHDINEPASYTIELKNVSDEEIDSRYIPVDFAVSDNNSVVIPEPTDEPEIIDMTNYVPEPVSLEEIRNSPEPPYTLFYFIDNKGEIQLRAYGEVYKYKYVEDINGNLIMDIDDSPEEFGKGMYPITPVKRTFDGNTVIDFMFFYEGAIEDNKSVSVEDEPFQS